MRRLNKSDWRIINAALAELESEELQLDEHANTIANDEDAQRAFAARIAATRRKVLDRLEETDA